MSEGRTVHTSWAQMEVVRYNRAGKWYLEPVGDVSPRQHVSIRDAAEYAVWAFMERQGELFLGRSGGGAFDRLVNS